jgi:4-hydroxybenzoyl-CoA thioesterase
VSVFALTVPIRFGDCDAAGIVFYPRYFEMLNRTVEDWFSGPLGRSFKWLHVDEKVGVPTARFEVDFKKASRLEEVLEFRLGVERLGRSSCLLRIQAWCGDELRLDVRQTIVFVDLAAMKPQSWPADLRARMQPYLIEEAA